MKKINKKEGIKKLVNTRRSKKISQQIARGFMIAKKWQQEYKDKKLMEKIFFDEQEK